MLRWDLGGRRSYVVKHATRLLTGTQRRLVFADFPVWRLELNSSLQLESFATETIGCGCRCWCGDILLINERC
jgi:hypothetical protein